MDPNVLPPGWTISSRLMACWTFDDGSTIEVAPPGYRLALADGITVFEDADFFPVEQGWRAVLECFTDFLRYYTWCDHGVECPFAPGWHEWCKAHEQEIENLHDSLSSEQD